MENLAFRGLDDRVIDRLETPARASQRSLEGQARHVLTQQVDRPGRIADFRERTRQLASLTAATSQTDSADLRREDRER